jgi:alpha-amylase/alpha-mannosidase (GH57 family)
VFPRLVKLYEDKGFIWVMEKVKVTEKGVIEGTGPAAERVQKVYEQFLSEIKSQ